MRLAIKGISWKKKKNLKDNEEIISEQNIQLENKEEEIKILKTKVTNLTK
jgi:hypothetical protein